jgi:biopolymer transport protein ExbB
MNLRTTARLVLLSIVLLGALAWSTPSLFAQDAAAAGAAGAGAAPVVEPKGVVAIVLGNLDFVFYIIGILSIVSFALIVQAFLKMRGSVLMPETSTAQIEDMIKNRQFEELITFTENDPSFVSQSLNPALKRAPKFAEMKEAMETALGEQTANEFRRIEYLNIIGNLGPLLGLLGTVLGMIDSFSAMQAAGGNANPAVLAGGISKALAHTFLGLFLAVPCLGAYGVLRQMTDKLTMKASLKAEELLNLMKPDAASSSSKPAAPKVAAKV